jgi:hypothetical protein
MKSFTFFFNQIETSYELTPVTSQKSFYGKAEVYVLKDGTKILRSYSTYVAGIDKDGNPFRSWWGWSATTGKHIKSFLGVNKKGFEALPFVEIH